VGEEEGGLHIKEDKRITKNNNNGKEEKGRRGINFLIVCVRPCLA
jgi:hypothetical protein